MTPNTTPHTPPQTAPQWTEIELTVTAPGRPPNPYTDLHAVARFDHDSGLRISRPLFWDGGNVFRCRFASPVPDGNWKWRVMFQQGVVAAGDLQSTPAQPTSPLLRHGFLRLSPKSHRNLLHADGTPYLLVADTPWALPWRATVEQVRTYARDRAAKGFNAAMLMVVQPDMRAEGPESRSLDHGFARGFDDLHRGTLQQLRPDYFQYLDTLISILVEHGIVPVYQPVFHGYGWKGLSVAGAVASPSDMDRFQRYLIARYGARPAIWLVGGDGDGRHPNIAAAGECCEREDAYAHPTGIHYRPHAIANAHHSADWLDFQWCQTGHNGEHMPERVAHMASFAPTKAVANGEPTYENIGTPGRAAGWWQGHEAWSNLCAGGTMGVVYGAGSLWQWRLHADEPGHQDWCHARSAGWREALEFEGSRYVGAVSRVFAGLDFDGMNPNWWFSYGCRGLEVPGKLFLIYRQGGEDFAICSAQCPRHYTVIDPKTAGEVGRGDLPADTSEGKPHHIKLNTTEPRLVVFTPG
jgi:hypothetical protein